VLPLGRSRPGLPEVEVCVRGGVVTGSYPQCIHSVNNFLRHFPALPHRTSAFQTARIRAFLPEVRLRQLLATLWITG
jgi:hypothetical protein